jgi:predicted Zn-dependent protease
LKEAWKLDPLTTEDEIRLGRELHGLILQFNRPMETGTFKRRLEEAAEPYLKAVSRKDIPYTFTVLDSNNVNAFSHPGGFIYVSRGLFNLIGEDEEDALEFVVAHEIAHVDFQHAVMCLRNEGVAKLKEGTLRKLYMLILPFAYYPDELDYDADLWAYRQMIQRDHTPHEALKFLRKLEYYSKAHEFYDGRVKPKPGRDASPIENHLRAHPAAWKRLKKLKELTQAASSPKK